MGRLGHHRHLFPNIRKTVNLLMAPLFVVTASSLSLSTGPLCGDGSGSRQRFLLKRLSNAAFCCSSSSRPLFLASGVGSSGGDSSGDDDDDASSSAPPQQETLDSLAQKLAESRCSNVIVLIGAGASVNAGIPDFRTPGTGLYDRLQHYNLPFPEAIFDLDYYIKDPFPFINLAQSLWPGQKGGPKPTMVHAFCKVLQEKGCLRRVYTQNIDGLEALAGVSTDKLVECHGHFRTASCVACHAEMAIDQCKEMICSGQEPMCSVCGGLVKPDVVFFGEELPYRFQRLLNEDVKRCDLLMVIGTSLLVMPVAGIPSWVSRSCPRILLNRELVGDFVVRGKRDVYLQGDCDESVQKICKLAGWQKELENCYETLHST